MDSAKEQQVLLSDCIKQSILKAETILNNLAKQAETYEVEKCPFGGEEASSEEKLERASTQRNSSRSSSSKKSEKPRKSGKKEKKKGDQRVQITPPKEDAIGQPKTAEQDGVTMQFAVNIRNPDGEKRTIDFRLDCVNYKPTRAYIDGKCKKIRPVKE